MERRGRGAGPDENVDPAAGLDGAGRGTVPPGHLPVKSKSSGSGRRAVVVRGTRKTEEAAARRRRRLASVAPPARAAPPRPKPPPPSPKVAVPVPVPVSAQTRTHTHTDTHTDTKTEGKIQTPAPPEPPPSSPPPSQTRPLEPPSPAAAGSAEIERMARRVLADGAGALTRPAAPGEEEAWAQQQREQMMRRRRRLAADARSAKRARRAATPCGRSPPPSSPAGSPPAAASASASASASGAPPRTPAVVRALLTRTAGGGGGPGSPSGPPGRGPASAPLDTRTLEAEIFAPGSGIADAEVRAALRERVGKGVGRWELRRQLEASAAAVARLRAVLHQLHGAKGRYVAGAIEAERAVRAGWAQALERAEVLDGDREDLKGLAKRAEAEAAELRVEARDAARGREEAERRVRDLEEDAGPLREGMARAEQARAEALTAAAVAGARADEATRQAEEWRRGIEAAEKSKTEAIERADAAAAAASRSEAADLREEIASLLAGIAARDEELGNLTGGDGSVDGIKSKLDALRGTVRKLESDVVAGRSELEKAEQNGKAAEERAAAKDRDLSELAKGLQQMQQSGLAREEEEKELRKTAEEKASDMERLYTEARHDISVIETEKCSLAKLLETTKSSLANAENVIRKIKDDIAQQKAAAASLRSQIDVEKELRIRAEEVADEERRERVAASAQMVAMTQESAMAEAAWIERSHSTEKQLRQQNKCQESALKDIEAELGKAKEAVSSLKGERESLKRALNEEQNSAQTRNVEEVGRLMVEISALKKRLEAEEERESKAGDVTRTRLLLLEEQLRESQAERNRLHTLVQELRGNVRVIARVRPFLPDDNAGVDAEPCVVAKNDTEMKLVRFDDPSSSTTQEHKEYRFGFDRVFAPSQCQDVVFQEVSDFVQSALDGFNVSLFSYGQTGSGKTYTMQGSGVGNMRGIIPRSLELIGKHKETLEKEGWCYEVSCSYLEIYKEVIRDLFRSNKKDGAIHDIKVDKEGNRTVSNLTIRPLDPSDGETRNKLMRLAANNRAVGATNMNDFSSRSHAVFTLYLRAVHNAMGQTLRSTLNLIDLAGSERLNRSGATGLRAKETVAINKSLSSLTDVFVALGKKSSHVPYRNSKLTHLLEPCLSGEGKTLMIVNLSPTEASAQESLCSLRFASNVNQVELGRAKRRISASKKVWK